MSNSLKYDLALFHTPGIGTKTSQQLIDILKSYQLTLGDIFEKPSLFDDIIQQSKLPQQNSLQQKIVIKEKKIEILKKYIHQPAWDLVDDDLKWQERSNHHLLSYSDQNYPQLLKQQHSYPMILYVMGNPQLLHDIQIAMVGSRNPTPTALETAKLFAYYLAQNGMLITSGLALGIDAASHKGALQANGKTIAVAGTGIDRVYPAKHKELAHQIVENGAIVSEFPLGTAPLRANFPKRNQTISALSVGTLVVEAALKSGSLITARLAMEQGREVFAIPGSIHNPLAKGCHYLIKQGAKLVENAQDIIEEIHPLSLASTLLQQKNGQQKSLNNEPQKHSINSTLPKDQQLLLQFIDDNPLTSDQLQNRCQLSIDEVNSLLVLLEIQGYIKSLPGGKVVLCSPNY
jgi:DNA processing protein